MSLHCGAVCGRGVQEGTMLLAPLWLLASFQSLPLLPISKLGPSGADSPGGWVCVRSRILWVSLTKYPVRLGVSPAASTLIGIFSQRFWDFISLCWNPGLHGLSCSPVVPPGLSVLECGTTQSTNHCLTRSSSRPLAMSPLYPAAHLCPSYQSGWLFLLYLLGCCTSIQFDFLSVLVVFWF